MHRKASHAFHTQQTQQSIKTNPGSHLIITFHQQNIVSEQNNKKNLKKITSLSASFSFQGTFTDDRGENVFRT